MISDIRPDHYPQILKINQTFVHWLSPLDAAGLKTILALAHYAKQIDDAQAILIGYDHGADYDHKNLSWLRARFDAFFYIDRIIIDSAAQGKGYARALYEDFETEARRKGLPRLVCEVNTKPDNPGSHRFHEKMGFEPIGDVEYPDYNAAVRYYLKEL